jgi:hypothetical protein
VRSPFVACMGGTEVTRFLEPLTIPAERYVVVPIVDDVAQTELLHLPAPKHRMSAGSGWTQVTFTERIERGFPPASWPAACGAFTHGSIYVQAGPLEHQPVCVSCSMIVERARYRRARHQGAFALSSARGTDGSWHVRHLAVDTGLCGQRVEVKMGRKWPPTCLACITAGRALGVASPPAWRWSDEVEEAA